MDCNEGSIEFVALEAAGLARKLRDLSLSALEDGMFSTEQMLAAEALRIDKVAWRLFERAEFIRDIIADDDWED